MSEPIKSLPPSYFDERYAANPDPWQFETSEYEREKYAATLAAMPRGQLPPHPGDRLLHRRSHPRSSLGVVMRWSASTWPRLPWKGPAPVAETSLMSISGSGRSHRIGPRVRTT